MPPTLIPTEGIMVRNCLEKCIGAKNDQYLTSLHNFSTIILKKKIYAKEVPPFHLNGVIHLIINTLDRVELRVEYGWNFS